MTPMAPRDEQRQRWRLAIQRMWPCLVELDGQRWVAAVDLSASLIDGYGSVHDRIVSRYGVPNRVVAGAGFRGRPRRLLAWGPLVRALRRWCLDRSSQDWTADELIYARCMTERGHHVDRVARDLGRNAEAVKQILRKDDGRGVDHRHYAERGLLHARELAALLRIDRATLKNWRRSGLPCESFDFGGVGRFAFWPPEVVEWLRRPAQERIYKRLKPLAVAEAERIVREHGGDGFGVCPAAVRIGAIDPGVDRE